MCVLVLQHVHPRIWRQVEVSGDARVVANAATHAIVALACCPSQWCQDGALLCEVIQSMALDSFGFRLVVKPKVVAGDDDDVYSTDDTRYNEMLFHEVRLGDVPT